MTKARTENYVKLQSVKKRNKDCYPTKTRTRKGVSTCYYQISNSGTYELSPGCTLGIVHSFFHEDFATLLQKELYTTKGLHGSRSQHMIFNHPIPRDQITVKYTENTPDFIYSGKRVPSTLMGPFMRVATKLMEDLTRQILPLALVNLYKNERDSVSFHKDDERSIAKGSTICSMSLGTTRDFQIKSTKPDDRWVMTIPVQHNTLVLMGGANFQTDLSHGVPKQMTTCGYRLNITWRKII